MNQVEGLGAMQLGTLFTQHPLPPSLPLADPQYTPVATTRIHAGRSQALTCMASG